MYAQWILVGSDTYTITFDSQGGSFVSSITQTSGTSVILPTTTRNGYTFNGWYSAASGGTKYGDGGDNYIMTGNITMYTMYAQWTENTVTPTYTINFDAQGGSFVSSITQTSGTSITLPTTTRSGYTFDGWYNSPNGTGTYYGGAGDSYTYTLTGNTISVAMPAYANWTFITGDGNDTETGDGNDTESGKDTTINGIACILVKAGSFTMGIGADPDYILWSPITQQVTLTQDFWISKYPITQSQYQSVMKNNPSYFSGTNNPVEKVTWYNANDFARAVGGILPTEAQWEFAARGGNKSQGYIYSGSNNLDEVGWYWENSNRATKPVGQKLPNELGIYDMTGNVFEWCSDWYGDYSSGAVTNPTGPITGVNRVCRGGRWSNNEPYCRVGYRNYNAPSDSYNHLGFRVAFPRN
jgi:uncharacterized repeat protein (TIGR02543 family)